MQERRIVHIPRSGTYGLNVLAAILFNFMDRLPNRLNVASMGRIGLRISAGTALFIFGDLLAWVDRV